MVTELFVLLGVELYRYRFVRDGVYLLPNSLLNVIGGRWSPAFLAGLELGDTLRGKNAKWLHVVPESLDNIHREFVVGVLVKFVLA